MSSNKNKTLKRLTKESADKYTQLFKPNETFSLSRKIPFSRACQRLRAVGLIQTDNYYDSDSKRSDSASSLCSAIEDSHLTVASL